MTTPKLKPCPFCGEMPAIIGVQRGFGPWNSCVCHSCPQWSSNEADRDAAIKDWNRRVSQIDEVDVASAKLAIAKWNRRAGKGRKK